MIFWMPVLCPCSGGSTPVSEAQIFDEGMDFTFSIETVECERSGILRIRICE